MGSEDLDDRWMRCMDEFVSYFQQIEGLSKRADDPLSQSVTVALIDDGVDIFHPELRNKKLQGESFDFYEGGSQAYPYWVSASGHGTLMARLINRLCPSAVIYVIKLRRVPTVDSATKVQIDPRSAIQAIEHAIERGAQVISMSWTTNPPKDPADKAAFDDAIRKAYNMGTVMFCSASDQGRFRDHNYPHASNPNYMIRIGATDAQGRKADYVTDDQDVNFVFPGREVVPSSLYEDITDNSFRGSASLIGSSIATALASGLAVLALECVRLGVLYTMEVNQAGSGGAIRREDLSRIQDKKAMEYALKSINVNQQVDEVTNYIEVWDTFSEATRKLKRIEGNHLDQLEIIAGLARLFLRKDEE